MAANNNAFAQIQKQVIILETSIIVANIASTAANSDGIAQTELVHKLISAYYVFIQQN